MRKLGFSFAFVLTFGVSAASAQSLEDEQAAMEGDEGGDSLGSPTGEPGGAADGEAPRLDDEQAEIADEETREEFRDTTDPFEAQNTDYFFLGAFSRAVIIPGFIQGLFVEGGIDGLNPGVGLEFNWRRNQFNVIAQVWWNNAVADGFFRASGDLRTDTEYIDVDLGVVFINAAFLWSFPLTDWFAFELGFDLGVGFIYGNLVRTEAYESTSGAGDFQACSGPGDSSDTGGYCEARAPDPCYDNRGGHYRCREPNWLTEGGDTPIVIPWISLPHIALRFKPIRQFQIRIDGGYGLYNFFIGGSLAYGF